MTDGPAQACGGKAFPAVLAQARAGAGFPTAYKFYHNNGGRRHFPFTYAYYARFERGAALPRPAWLNSILGAMRVAVGDEVHRRFMRAFLVDLLGGEETFDLFSGALAGPGRETAFPLGREALRWMKAHHSVHLTQEQFRALSADETVYWCSEALLNDSGAWNAAELAAALDLPRTTVAAALTRLKAIGLAVSAPGGKVRGRWAGKLYTFPGRLAGMDGCLGRVKGYWARMERRRGASIAERVELVRGGADGMLRYWRELGESLEGANAYGVHRGSPDSGLYIIEARLRRLTPF